MSPFRRVSRTLIRTGGHTQRTVGTPTPQIAGQSLPRSRTYGCQPEACHNSSHRTLIVGGEEIAEDQNMNVQEANLGALMMVIVLG